MADLFSTAALLILFREALEASVIISIMLQMCERLKMNALKKYGERGLRCRRQEVVAVASSVLWVGVAIAL